MVGGWRERVDVGHQADICGHGTKCLASPWTPLAILDADREVLGICANATTYNRKQKISLCGGVRSNIDVI